MKDDGRIHVGVRYQCLRWPMIHFTIVHRHGEDGFEVLNYLGISDDGLIERFDANGADKFCEFGGCWHKLDTGKLSEPMWDLKHIPTEKLRSSL